MDSGHSTSTRDPKKAMQDLIAKIDFQKKEATQSHTCGVNQNPDTLTIGKYLKDLVYGGLDGLITTFAVVSGVSGTYNYNYRERSVFYLCNRLFQEHRCPHP